MARPALLVVDPDSSRRRVLARGLSGFGYEVVPAVDAAEGRRFAAGLGPAVVVAAADLPGVLATPGETGDWGGFGPGAGRTLLLVGRSEEEARALPQEILFLADRGLAGDDLVRRVRLVLLGSEIGVEPDARLETLVGDLALVPFLELLRALHQAGFSGLVALEGGEVTLAEGEVVAARVATASGVFGEKAFCRLARREAGPFHVLPGGGTSPAPASPTSPALGRQRREIENDLTALLILAIEDRVHGAPGPEVRVRLSTGPAYFSTPFTLSERRLLAVLTDGPTVGQILDSLPATDGEILRDLLAFSDRGLVAFEEPRTPVSIVTDSAADLPADLARAHGISVVPIHVLFGEEDLRDGVDLAPREFYDRLERGGPAPRTRPPGPEELAGAYRRLVGRGELISLHLSEKLSQTVVHARTAADALAEPGSAHAAHAAHAANIGDIVSNIASIAGAAAREWGVARSAPRVVDSGSVSLGLGLLALFAARLARRGVPAAEIGDRLGEIRGRLHVLFVVDTLEYLVRGGKIGRARGTFGNLLGIKPILGVVDGEVVPVDQVRGGRAAHPRLLELFRERVAADLPVIAGVAHAKAPVWADRLRELLTGAFDVRELLVTEMGPVVGTHAGPGTVGAVVFQPTPEELPLLAPLEE
jgi:fatty acid-binding protein DegV/CheY-like chemotaxis protein